MIARRAFVFTGCIKDLRLFVTLFISGKIVTQRNFLEFVTANLYNTDKKNDAI